MIRWPSIRWSLFLLVLLISPVAFWAARYDRTAKPEPPPPPPAIDRVRQLGLLTTLAVDVADVRETEIRGHTGGAQLVLILRGDALLSVDLAQALVTQSDAAARRAIVTLPAPVISQVRVDTQRSKVYRIDRSGLWLLRPNDELTARLVNAALADAQKGVKVTASQPELANTARRHAERLIHQWAEVSGWSVEVRWR